MIDLHLHSTASDGQDAPQAVIQKALQAGITFLSLTDHDTVSGLAEAQEAALHTDLTFIPGIEITTDYKDTELHLLGYYIDYHDRRILQACEEIHQGRRRRGREILGKLAQQGFSLSWEEVSETSDGFVGRSHILDKLVDKGLVAPWNRDVFFDTYLSKTGSAYVPHYYISPGKAVELVWNSGGVPVLAHPGRMRGEWRLRDLVEMGIAGIEAWYPAHSSEQVRFYLQLAEKFNLIPTGGSDYHGRGERSIGMPGAPEETVQRLRERANRGGGLGE